MKNTFLFAFLILLAFGCVKENFEQEVVGTAEIDTDGNDYYIKGTIDGMPFEIWHSNDNQSNTTGIGNWGVSRQSAFQTGFYQTYPHNDLYYNVLSFQITSDTLSETSIEDIVSVGELEFFDGEYEVTFSNGVFVYKPSIGEVNLGVIEFDNVTYEKIKVHPFNKFEVTEFEKLPLSDEPIITGSSYNGKLYRMRGHFQSKVIAPDSSEVDLIVDDFSAIIIDKKF